MLRVCEGRVLFGVGFIFIIFVVDLGSIVVIGLVFVVLAFTPSGATQVRMGTRTTTRFSRQRLDSADFVNSKVGGNSRCPSGCMRHGRRETRRPWHRPTKTLGLTRIGLG